MSKKKNKIAIATKSQALSLNAQGAIKTSAKPCSAAPVGRWSKTSKLWERIKSKLAKYLKKTNCQLPEFMFFIFSRNIVQCINYWNSLSLWIFTFVVLNTKYGSKLK